MIIKIKIKLLNKMVSIVNGNILDYTEDNKNVFICHQTNCVTKTSAGLAKSIFDKYPESNIYKNNNILRTPGVYIETKTNDGKTIIHLNAQNNPGKVSNKETSYQRLEWFQSCLALLSHDINNNNFINNTPEIILFPYGIGCGLAGGNWDDYLKSIGIFNQTLPKHITLKIILLP